MMKLPYETEQITVNRKCGHVEEVAIRKYKRSLLRENKIADLKSGLCRACYEESIRSEYDLVSMQIHYSLYKQCYRACLVKSDSYDAKSKNITVYVRREHKPQNEMIPYLMENCRIKYDQAKYLTGASSMERDKLKEWFELTDHNEMYEEALSMINDNEPSHYYADYFKDYDDEDDDDDEVLNIPSDGQSEHYSKIHEVTGDDDEMPF